MPSSNGQTSRSPALPASLDQAFYQALFEHAGVGLVYRGRTGNLLWVNDFFCHFVGRTHAEVAHLTPAELTYPADREATAQVIERAMRGEVDAQPLEKRYLHADGGIRWAEVRLRPVLGADGQTEGVVAAVVDITARRAAEEALRASEERLETQFRGMPLPTYAWRALDGDFVLADYNLAAEAATGGQVRRLLDSVASDLYADNPEFHRAMARCYHSRGPVELDTWYTMRTTGLRRYLSIHYAFVPPDMVLVSTNDITEHKQTEEALRVARDALEQRVRERTAELERANAALRRQIAERERAEARAAQRQAELAHAARLYLMGEMATGVAHELNQPLSAISTYAGAAASLLKGEHPEAGEAEEALEQILLQATRAAEIIRRLRDFVRKSEPQTAATDINGLVRDVLEFMQAPARQFGAQLKFSPAPALPPVQIDPIQVEQVLVNLLHNAMEAMAEAGCTRRDIAIQTCVQDEHFVRIEVRDTGPGLLPEQLQQAFDAFVTSKPTGMGMGLAISRTLIESMHGRLWADSVPGQGARFMFTLPVA